MMNVEKKKKWFEDWRLLSITVFFSITILLNSIMMVDSYLDGDEIVRGAAIITVIFMLFFVLLMIAIVFYEKKKEKKEKHGSKI